jgi:hypothetical protein
MDSAVPFGGPAALFEVMGTTLRGVRSRGFHPGEEPFEELKASYEEGPAFAHAIRERETVVAIGMETEISIRIAKALPLAPGEKVYLFPMVIQEKVVAILYVTQVSDRAALELLTGTAASAAQILASEQSTGVRQAAPELIAIEGVDMLAHAGAAAGDIRRQALEARARWFARAEVARMRVFRKSALERGRLERDIYSALKPEIESARRTYHQDFLAVSPVIADYLHRELVSLVHDDINLLGPEYPGSLG